MRKSLLILTPDPDYKTHSRWPAVVDAYRAALSDLPVDIFTQPWSAPLTRDYDLVCPLVVWGYHNAPDDFRKSLAYIKAKGHRLMNPTGILAWNIDKHYLRDLSQSGIRTVPTLFAASLTPRVIANARADFNQQKLVIKPVISAGSKNTFILDTDHIPPIHWGETGEAGGGSLMLQPFMPAIQSEGEWSLLFYSGQFSHAVLKTPKSGDFRSQPDYDANLRTLPVPPEALELAYEALDYAGGPDLLYARVDMVRNDSGQPCLMELELIEPDLYLTYDPDAPARLAHAFSHVLGLGCTGSGHHHN
ncbi:ATP-grasp domain-containing protein [Asticcacaulis tiandongensis]|uniref:ATP-grasp domain-containing protein n=1 Tax=Asticcacaulis tiandongensis TaxID=2565365 RepID=UPI0011288015|nr:hypothetical protein [Asticcacaulis tiandongensis]